MAAVGVGPYLIPLPIHSYKADTASTGRLVNVYAEPLPAGAKGAIVVRRAPGIASFTSGLVGHGRGLHAMAGQLYAVAGITLYRISASGAVAALGTIAGEGPVFMADNGTQLAISHDGRLSVLEGGVLSLVSDPDLIYPIGAIDFLDNYLIGVREGTGQFGSSALADFTDWDGLDFATAEAAPDPLVSLVTDRRAAVLFGQETTEIWDNVGGTGFPFARVVNGVLELGIAGKHARCKLENTVFWLANDRTLRRLDGASPVRVSQHGFERAIREYARVDDCELRSYTLDGHLCVSLDFPSEGRTWIYDATTQEFYEREGTGTHWDVADVQECYGRVFVQRRSSGQVGTLDAGVFTQWGDLLRAAWTYQPVYSAGNRIAVHELRLGIETGVGNTSTVNPRITLEVSTEAGREGTFRALPVRELGRQGKFSQEVRWHRLGSGTEMVFRCSVAEPVAVSVYDTRIEAEELA